jgi:Calcineurin-like phosphoesterase
MKLARLILVLCCCALMTSTLVMAEHFGSNPAIMNDTSEPPVKSSWYFAVSGDSRDCGDLIMPKIAKSIAEKRKQLPIKFYWHLGDFRALYRVDCDIALPMDPSFKCVQGSASPSETALMRQEYLKAAWPDFIEHQVVPFEHAGIPIYLGFGNHELIKRTRQEVATTFNKWLTQPAIKAQRKADAKKKIVSTDGATYFHFVMDGVDFITLDNASIYDVDTETKKPDPGFSAEQLKWLDQILRADAANKSIKTVVVGMHAALPESVSKSHAMDRSCESFCGGKQAYAMLEHLHSAGKNVLVLASHSHYVEPNAYNTSQLKGHELPGWIIGTAGAEQYRLDIKYGYLLVEVKPDGTVHASFEEVKRDSADPATPLFDYCFEKNKKLPDPNEKHVTAKDCTCQIH